jgi:signal transduction histidine kinase
VLLSNARAAWYLRGDDDQDLIGLPLMDLLNDVVPEQAGQWPDLLRQVMLEGKRSQSGARHRNGRDLLVQVAALNTESVRLSGLVFNFSDISLLKASERKRNELLNFLSHDLRAPLVSPLYWILPRPRNRRTNSLHCFGAWNPIPAKHSILPNSFCTWHAQKAVKVLYSAMSTWSALS